MLVAAELYAQVPEAPQPPAGKVVREAPTESAVPADVRPEVAVTDDERAAVEVTALNLDLHLIPADAREEAHATLTVRNVSAKSVARIPLQLSSTLHWLAISAAGSGGLTPVAFSQSPIATDADHTGYAEEAVVTPAAALAPGATLVLSVVYGGHVKRAADRLELIGAPKDRAEAADWDQIAPASDDVSTALRGFGDVLWYPVAEPTAVFGNGNQLFDLVARVRQRNIGVMMGLRLTVEYVGDPPDSVIFNGQMQPLARVPDAEDQLVTDTHGTATAEFPAAAIGLRTPSLFLTAQHAATTADQLLTVVTPQAAAATQPYAEAAASLSPLLASFLGETPRSSLLLLDHDGDPFEDAGFIAAQLTATVGPAAVAQALVRGMTHAWMQPQSRVIPAAGEWVAEGLPEFMSVAWVERTRGRDQAIGLLRHSSSLIALAEPDLSVGATSTVKPQPLIDAYADVYLRLKAGFVFWQLRGIVGDAAFSQALTAYRKSVALNPELDRDPRAFQRTIEKASGKDLGWFFDDWVMRDRGLPDLTIVQANPRTLPARAGRSGGYLVAVEVRNDGDAVAEVPVTVRAGTLEATERLRIAGHASASTRIVFEGTPETVEVNDGTTPEVRSTTHTFTFGTATTP